MKTWPGCIQPGYYYQAQRGIFIEKHTVLHRFIGTIILLGAYLTGGAQSPWDNYELLTTRQGLPHNTVQALLQDREGFLWIGTHGGLCRYDGNKLTEFNNVFGPAGKTNWFYEALFEDINGNIWIGSRGGNLSCYLKQKNSFKHYTHKGNTSARLSCFYQDSVDKTIWIGNDAGELLVYKGDSVSVTSVGVGNIIDMKQVEQNILLLLTSKGLFLYDIHRGITTYLKAGRDFDKREIVTGAINNMAKTVMLVDNYGCYITGLKQQNIIQYVPVEKIGYRLFHRIALTGEGDFLYCDGSIIYVYDPYGKLKNKIAISEIDWYNRNEVINSMIEDRSGIIWLGTNSGLYKVDRNKYQFTKIAAAPLKARITDNYVRSVLFDDRQNLWVGFRGNAVNRLSGDNRLSTYSLLDKDGQVKDKYIINTIFQLRNHNILFGAAQGVFVNDNETSTIVPFAQGVLPDTLAEVWALHQDKARNIWIGTRVKGLYIFNPESNKLVQYKYLPGIAGSARDSSVWNIYQDRQGDTWLGTDYGVCRVTNPEDIYNLNFERFDFGDNPPLHVWNITESLNGKLFIGTIGEGLYEISADRTKTKRHADFPADIVASMAFDETGYLWATSINGLYKYNVSDGSYTYFSEDDGLASNDFNFKALAQSATGDIFLGGKMGVVAFKPLEVQPKNLASVPVRIASLRIAGYDSSAAIYSNSAIELTRKQNFLNIGFAVMDYTKPLRHRYRYMLKGFEHKWNYRDNTQPWATYTNLPPGDYSFVVQGSGDGIQWSDRQAVLNFYIKPALWQRPVVQLLLLVFILSAIGWAVYYKTRSVVRKERERNKIEKQIAGLELRALQAQMNPHFIFNVLNSIQQFVIHNNELAANDYLTRFARLMRLFLESSKNRYVTLETEIDQLSLYLSLEKLRFDDKFEYTIKADVGLSKSEIQIPSMLIQPFAENAINHGLVHKTQKGRLFIEFVLMNNNMLKCTIDDDGVGRREARRIEEQKNKKHISRGMQLIEERVKTYNFIEDIDIRIQITDKEPPHIGTKVEIIIPLSPSVKHNV